MRSVASARVKSRGTRFGHASFLLHRLSRRTCKPCASLGDEMPATSPANPSDMTVHLLWINAGLSCDGDSVSLTNAQLPSIEDIVMGAIPGLPKVQVHWPLVDY